MVVAKHRGINANIIYKAFKIYLCSRCINKSVGNVVFG